MWLTPVYQTSVGQYNALTTLEDNFPCKERHTAGENSRSSVGLQVEPVYTGLCWWLVLLTVRVKMLPDLPEASRVQALQGRSAGAVHGAGHPALAQAGNDTWRTR